MKGADYTARLEAEVTRLLAVVDDKERALATIALERPLSITLQRAEARAMELEAALRTVLASAYPNKRDHPTMSEAWSRAQAVLDGGKP